MSRKRRQLPQDPRQAVIESLTHEGKGVTHVDGKAVFIDGALPGEEVRYILTRSQRRFDNARAVEILTPSPDRVEPKCRHYGLCGGCSLQHLDSQAQIRIKEKVLLDDFQHLGGISPESVLPALTGPAWGYRRKARLGVKYVAKKEKVLVGFREKASPYLAELECCEVLHPDVGQRLQQLADLIAGLEAYQRIAQIEVAVGDTATALVFRNLDPLSATDQQALRAYGEQQGLQIWLQSGGPDTTTPLYPEQAELSYRLDAYGLEYAFQPNDFTQVNRDINQSMVARALALLELEPQHRVLDLFCGLGNFTLPLARLVRQVVGVEGEAGLVERARANARRNGIENAEFHVADLSDDHSHVQAQKDHWLQGPYDRILLDPARSGALEMMEHLPRLGAKRIVYVSCNPATLARDAGELVKKHGYRLVQAGVMDMFPHTAHVESIALFVKD